jgi:hypothetical protein
MMNHVKLIKLPICFAVVRLLKWATVLAKCISPVLRIVADELWCLATTVPAVNKIDSDGEIKVQMTFKVQTV